MKPILIAGMTIVNLALISYSLFFYFERKAKMVSSKVLSFLTIGIFFDIIATACMIIGSSKGPFTFHGLLGYSSLAGMLVDAVLLWRARLVNGNGYLLSKALHTYSLIAYLWWVAAYITGAILVMGR
jgi:hypothetical protein